MKPGARNPGARIVALEMSTAHGSVALMDEGVVHERDFDPRGEGAVGALARIFAEFGVQPRDLTAFAVSVGPGSFTGIRVGVSAAQAFCHATGAVAVPVGTLEGLAECGRESDWGMSGTLLLPSVDARRGEVYAALYRAGGAGTAPELLWGPEAVSCAALAERLAGMPAPSAGPEGAGGEGLLLGDGAPLLASLFPDGWASPAALARTRAAAVARVAARKLAAGGSVAPVDLVPVYVRKPDAESRDERRTPAP